MVCNQKNNNKGYFDNIKLKDDEISRINYHSFFMYSKPVKQLEKLISEQINKHLGKSKDNPKKLHWDKDPNKGCKNGKLLNVRRFGSLCDYINKINSHYDELFEKKFSYLKGQNYNEMDYYYKYKLLQNLNEYVTKLENEKKVRSCPCASKNDYKEVKSQTPKGLNASNGSWQGMY